MLPSQVQEKQKYVPEWMPQWFHHCLNLADPSNYEVQKKEEKTLTVKGILIKILWVSFLTKQKEKQTQQLN